MHLEKQMMLNETKVETVIKINDIIEKEEVNQIVETITYIKLWLVLFTLILIKVILIKTINICKRFYTVHNERVIRNHNTTGVQT